MQKLEINNWYANIYRLIMILVTIHCFISHCFLEIPGLTDIGIKLRNKVFYVISFVTVGFQYLCSRP